MGNSLECLAVCHISSLAPQLHLGFPWLEYLEVHISELLLCNITIYVVSRELKWLDICLPITTHFLISSFSSASKKTGMLYYIILMLLEVNNHI